MDRNKLKKLVLELKRELRERISQEIEKDSTIKGKTEKIKKEQIIEEATYTWFIRIITIKYMQIHNYLQIDSQKQKEILFSKKGILEICQKLQKLIPQVFREGTEYIDKLITEEALSKNGKIAELLEKMTEKIFQEEQVIGWLYQYYISEDKEKVFEKLKKNIKISKKDIPVATQLFTPEWIVKYMVDNTLGRYLKDTKSLKYYIGNEDEKKEKIINIEKITFLDPCCGSGHILIYAFEVLIKLYIEQGYKQEEAVSKILKNNLYGIDIDKRATELAILTLTLKARAYDENFFDKNIVKDINIITIKSINKKYPQEFTDEKDKEIFEYIVKTFENADEYGSLIKCEKMDYDRLSRENEYIKQAKILSNQYTVVCTNPPYMGKKSINSKLSNYLYQNYPTTKSEMYSAFIERCYNFTKEKGYLSMITIHSWMFISSFEELRNFILNNSTIINMVHTGASTFIDLNAFNVLATAFCLKKEKLNIKSTFVRLVDYYKTETKIENFRNTKNYYNINQDILNKIPQKPFVYWISDEIRNAFCNNKKLGKYYPPKQGIATADNKRFLRLWYEVDFSKIAFNISSEEESLKSNLKWYPYNKGGNYRKWYGNNEYVVNWQNNGKELKKFKKAVIRNKDYQLKEGITWSLFGFENFGVRYKEQGFIFDVSGSSMFPDKENLYYVIGYLCSNVAFKFLSILAPTVNFQVGNIASLPYKEIEDKSIINELVKENIEICKKDWDSYETSWNFKKHPLINDNHNGKLKEIMKKYKTSYNQIREKLKNNEQKLNKIYSEIFDVTTIETDVNDRDLTIKIFDEKGLIKSLISYSVGCMFGRYSLDKEGLVFAGGEFNFDKYKCFKPVIDNIIPLNDCIVNKFKEFIEVAYGKSNLNDNLDFIAEILGKRTNENSEATIRRYFMKDFYNEHFKIYHKKPIYWLLNDDDGNKCLTYMHRTYKYDIKGEK